MIDFPAFFESCHEALDPSYAVNKKNNLNSLKNLELISSAALISGIAFMVLGIALCSSGLGAIIGVPLVLISIPTCYFSYNGTRVLENLQDIFDNPKKLQNLYLLDTSFDKYSFKNKLKEGTFCFNWFIDAAIEQMVNNGTAK
jgi:hypothetical protein